MELIFFVFYVKKIVITKNQGNNDNRDEADDIESFAACYRFHSVLFLVSNEFKATA
jgi:hypothetical protein